MNVDRLPVHQVDQRDGRVDRGCCATARDIHDGNCLQRKCYWAREAINIRAVPESPPGNRDHGTACSSRSEIACWADSAKVNALHLSTKIYLQLCGGHAAGEYQTQCS